MTTTPWPWRAFRTTLLAAVAVALFTVALAIASRSIEEPVVFFAPDDAGVRVESDAGVDAGPPPPPPPPPLAELVTVQEGPDAGPLPDGGPPTAPEPPYDVRAIVIDAAALVEACAKEALRWDLSLGGPFSLSVRLPASDERDEVVVTVTGLRSPVLESCLARRRASLPLPSGAKDLSEPQVVVARGVLKSGGVVTVGDEAVVAAPRLTP